MQVSGVRKKVCDVITSHFSFIYMYTQTFISPLDDEKKIILYFKKIVNLSYDSAGSL